MLRKKNTVLAIVSVMVLGLLVTGVVGLAGGNGRENGAGDGTGTGSSLERDSDNDDILNHNDDDYTSPEDGGGYGVAEETGAGENGAGDGTGTGSSLERDSDNDDILNHNDDDYTSPEDGGGYGALGSFLESFFGFLF